MARDLNNRRDTSVDRPDASSDSRGKPTTLASELAADAYNIVVALAMLSLSYWVLFRNLPVELFTLGLAATGLIAVNVVVALRRWSN